MDAGKLGGGGGTSKRMPHFGQVGAKVRQANKLKRSLSKRPVDPVPEVAPRGPAEDVPVESLPTGAGLGGADPASVGGGAEDPIASSPASPAERLSPCRSFQFGEPSGMPARPDSSLAPEAKTGRRGSKAASRALSLSGSSITISRMEPRRMSSVTGGRGPVFPAVSGDSDAAARSPLLDPNSGSVPRRCSEMTQLAELAEAEMDENDTLASPAADLEEIIVSLCTSFSDTTFLDPGYEPAKDELQRQYHHLHRLYISTGHSVLTAKKLCCRVRKGMEVKSNLRTEAESKAAVHIQKQQELQGIIDKLALDIERDRGVASKKLHEAEAQANKAREAQIAEREYWNQRVNESAAVLEKQKEDFEMEMQYMLEEMKNGACSEVKAVSDLLDEEYTKVRNLKINLDAKTTQVQALKDKILQMEGNHRKVLVQLQDSFDELEQYKATSAEEVAKLNSLLADTHATTDGIQSQLSDALRDSAASKSQISELQALLQQSKSMEEELSQRVGSKGDLQHLEQQLQEYEARVAALEEELANSTTAQSQIDRQIQLRERLIHALRKQFGIMSMREFYLKLYRNMLHRQKEHAVGQLEDKLEDTRAKAAEIQRQKDLLESEGMEAKSRIIALESQNNDILSRSEEMERKHRNELEVRDGGLKKELAVRDEELRMRQSAIDDLRDSLELQRRRLKELSETKDAKRTEATLLTSEQERVAQDFLVQFRRFLELFKKKFRMHRLDVGELRVVEGVRASPALQILRHGTNFSRMLSNTMTIDRTLARIRHAQNVVTIGDRLRFEREKKRMALQKQRQKAIFDQLEKEEENVEARGAAASEVKKEIGRAVARAYREATVPKVNEAIEEAIHSGYGEEAAPRPEDVATQHFENQMRQLADIEEQALAVVATGFDKVKETSRKLEKSRAALVADMMSDGVWVYPTQKTLFFEGEVRGRRLDEPPSPADPLQPQRHAATPQPQPCRAPPSPSHEPLLAICPTVHYVSNAQPRHSPPPPQAGPGPAKQRGVRLFNANSVVFKPTPQGEVGMVGIGMHPLPCTPPEEQGGHDAQQVKPGTAPPGGSVQATIQANVQAIASLYGDAGGATLTMKSYAVGSCGGRAERRRRPDFSMGPLQAAPRPLGGISPGEVPGGNPFEGQPVARRPSGLHSSTRHHNGGLPSPRGPRVGFHEAPPKTAGAGAGSAAVEVLLALGGRRPSSAPNLLNEVAAKKRFSSPLAKHPNLVVMNSR